MKKEIEKLTLKDLQKYEELQKSLFTWVKKFIKDTAINKENEYHIEAVYAREDKLSVYYICLDDPYMDSDKQYHMNISYDVLLEYIEKYKNKKEEIK